MIDFPQFNQHTGPDIQLTGFIFGIGSPANVTATPLQLGAQLFLGKPSIHPKPAKIVSHIAVTPNFLLHFFTPSWNDQYWLQPLSSYAIMKQNIDRYTGQFLREVDHLAA